MTVKCCGCLRIKRDGEWTRSVLAYGRASDGLCPACRLRLYPHIPRRAA